MKLTENQIKKIKDQIIEKYTNVNQFSYLVGLNASNISRMLEGWDVSPKTILRINDFIDTGIEVEKKCIWKIYNYIVDWEIEIFRSIEYNN